MVLIFIITTPRDVKHSKAVQRLLHIECPFILAVESTTNVTTSWHIIPSHKGCKFDLSKLPHALLLAILSTQIKIADSQSVQLPRKASGPFSSIETVECNYRLLALFFEPPCSRWPNSSMDPKSVSIIIWPLFTFLKTRIGCKLGIIWRNIQSRMRVQKNIEMHTEPLNGRLVLHQSGRFNSASVWLAFTFVSSTACVVRYCTGIERGSKTMFTLYQGGKNCKSWS